MNAPPAKLSAINSVLVVDDEADIRELLEITLSRMDIEAVTAANVAEAKQRLAERPFGLCLTDMRLPDGTGMEIVDHIDRQHPDLPVAVITAYGNIEGAVQALQAGAFDFVSKPVDLDVLRRLITAALKRSPPRPPANQIASRLLGDSPAIHELRTLIAKLARSQAPVYIHGESGVGKELVARELHQAGPRASKPFIAVNCGAIPTELMESEFFGHVKGSFTGAIEDKPGLFAAADGGTLFLDEVADLPLDMQVKLLRAIQERAIKPIGAALEKSIDVRVLSATHKDLRQEVAAERFRQDLYYRLNVIEIVVPPLRERPEDIPVIAHSILSNLAAEWKMPMRQLSDDAIAALQRYPFPGNVRELTNLLERAATLADGPLIEPRDLALPEPEPAAETAAGELMTSLADQERQAIISALDACRWNRTAAAKKLGMTLRQLRYRLKKFEIV
ncbi:MAG TPA: sigma-54-dependent Fis family transcriptional regulator [Gammaproteobacteria bacterium]|nr:sigma-54-dependent Fis family transcriptional regulator [Gammaproteobacteria bacterium]